MGQQYLVSFATQIETTGTIREVTDNSILDQGQVPKTEIEIRQWEEAELNRFNRQIDKKWYDTNRLTVRIIAISPLPS